MRKLTYVEAWDAVRDGKQVIAIDGCSQYPTSWDPSSGLLIVSREGHMSEASIAYAYELRPRTFCDGEWEEVESFEDAKLMSDDGEFRAMYRRHLNRVTPAINSENGCWVRSVIAETKLGEIQMKHIASCVIHFVDGTTVGPIEVDVEKSEKLAAIKKIIDAHGIGWGSWPLTQDNTMHIPLKKRWWWPFCQKDNHEPEPEYMAVSETDRVAQREALHAALSSDLDELRSGLPRMVEEILAAQGTPRNTLRIVFGDKTAMFKEAWISLKCGGIAP